MTKNGTLINSVGLLKSVTIELTHVNAERVSRFTGMRQLGMMCKSSAFRSKQSSMSKIGNAEPHSPADLMPLWLMGDNFGQLSPALGNFHPPKDPGRVWATPGFGEREGPGGYAPTNVSNFF